MQTTSTATRRSAGRTPSWAWSRTARSSSPTTRIASGFPPPSKGVTTAILAQLAVSGALIGLVYALIAYGFQLTFATSKSINFGQGELVMISAFFSLTLITWGLPYWLVVPAGLVFGAALGLFVERAAVRLALEQKGEGWILLTIILGLFLNSVAENVWGRDDRPFPTPISSNALHLLGVNVTPVELSVAVGVF